MGDENSQKYAVPDIDNLFHVDPYLKGYQREIQRR